MSAGAGGSTYVNYADAAKSYDNARFTAGVDIILGGFAGSKTGVPLHQQKILDNGVCTLFLLSHM